MLEYLHAEKNQHSCHLLHEYLVLHTQLYLHAYFASLKLIIAVQVEQKARREDVLNQLLVLLNTAINRKQEKQTRGSSARGRRGSSRKHSSSKMEIIVMESTEEEDRDDDGDTDYMSGALGLIPTD